MITDSEQQQSQSPSDHQISYRPQRQRKLRPALLIFLVILAIFVALAAIIGLRLLEEDVAGNHQGNRTGFSPVQYGAPLGEVTVYLLHQQLLLYERACEVMHDLLGPTMSEGTLQTLVQRCAQILRDRED